MSELTSLTIPVKNPITQEISMRTFSIAGNEVIKNLAPMEENPAQSSHSIGDQFINLSNDKLYKATKAINVNDALIDKETDPTNGNIEKAPLITEQISSIHDSLEQKTSKNDITSLSESSASGASTNIEDGTYFYLDGVLKHALTDIASGASFTNSNCETVTAGALNELASSIRSLNASMAKAFTVKSVTAGTNISIIKGGYIRFGNIIVLSLKLKTTGAISINDILVSGLPSVYFSNVFINIGNDYNTNAYGCRMGGRNMYANGAIPNDKELDINAAYIIGQTS